MFPIPLMRRANVATLGYPAGVTLFSDTFTEASADTTLASHTPTVGTSWTLLWNVTATLGVVEASDTCKGGTAGDAGAIYTADATYRSANYYLQFTLVAGSNITTRPFYAFVRVQDVDNMYAMRMTIAANGVQLYKKVGGTWSTVGSANSGTVANGSVMKLQISGTTLTCYDDGVAICTGAVTNFSGAGKAGIGIGGALELVESTDDANSVWEIDLLSVVTV